MKCWDAVFNAKTHTQCNHLQTFTFTHMVVLQSAEPRPILVCERPGNLLTCGTFQKCAY